MKNSVGWREMIYLPELCLYPIKAKIDTGARTTALHAFNIEVVKRGRHFVVEFDIHPHQKSREHTKRVSAPFLEYRKIKSSVGTETLRPVVELDIMIGESEIRTEVTLVNRDMMGFRMLIGRQTLKEGKYLVDVSKSFLTNSKNCKKLKKLIIRKGL